MSEREKRELDAWIEINIFGRDDVTIEPPQNGDVYRVGWDNTKRCVRNFTTEPAAAMVLLRQCNEEVSRRHITDPRIPFEIRIGFASLVKEHWVSWTPLIGGQSESLELAICLFARKLFTK